MTITTACSAGVGQSTPPNTYRVIVEGTGGGLIRSTQFNLIVKAVQGCN
jgi:hypothetical protein